MRALFDRSIAVMLAIALLAEASLSFLSLGVTKLGAGTGTVTKTPATPVASTEPVSWRT